MNLWVRSQDRKRLVECHDFNLQEKLQATFAVLGGRGGTHILGTYKNRQRALEVLDEIQKLLMGVDKIVVSPIFEQKIGLYNELVTIPKDDIKITSLQTIVYEMPKE